MDRDVKADLRASVDEQKLSIPPIGELRRIVSVLAEWRDHITTAVHERAIARGLSDNLAIKVIHLRHQEIARDLITDHQGSRLALFLDTDGTDQGLQRLPVGCLHEGDVEAPITEFQGKHGRIVGPANNLTAVFCNFLSKHGYAPPIPAEGAVPRDRPGAKGSDPSSESTTPGPRSQRKRMRETLSSLKSAGSAFQTKKAAHDAVLKKLGIKGAPRGCSYRTFVEHTKDLLKELPD